RGAGRGALVGCHRGLLGLIEWSRTANIIRMITMGEESMPESATLAETIAHPVRLRIIQQLGGRSLTTAQLREALPDVTQATLYRHVRALLDAELLTVVEERKVRGALERTLALGEQMAHVDQEGLRAMSAAQLREAFLVFLGGLAEDFDRLRSEEHTSELQSRFDLVCRLLLAKK